MKETSGKTLQGHALLQELREGWLPLPPRVMLSLVLAGLRVRLSRSVVTIMTVVLAIAYLSYTGLNEKLNRNLAVLAGELSRAGGAGEGIRDGAALAMLLREAGVNVELAIEGGAADRWVRVMALLLCTAGIANAMLMSVTERFREIGTMKCLGAQDSLVVKLFLLESAFLGVAGAALGSVLGTVVALGAGWLQFGAYALEEFPLWQGLSVIGYALLAGVLLAVAGTLYPALVAARMKPVDALRVDE